MRRAIFLILIAITLLITAFFCWREFVIPDINYVDDTVETDAENQLTVKRLYAKGVDEDAYAEALEAIQNMTEGEFEEDDIVVAARKSGVPEFYPGFNFSVYKTGDEIYINGFVSAELAEGQQEMKFMLADVSFEAVAKQGLTIDEFDITPLVGHENDTFIRVNSAAAAAADLSKAAGFDIKLKGTGGSVTLQYVYKIQSDTFMPQTVLEDQLLQIQIDITTDENGNVKATYTAEPYSSLDEMEGNT